MTYIKLIAEGGSKSHLARPGQADEGTTLCGCTVTRIHNWKRISTLEGDECPSCADRTFWATVPSHAAHLGSAEVVHAQ